MLSTSATTETAPPAPSMAPYPLPKEDVKWVPNLQPPAALGVPATEPTLLPPVPGNAADFGNLPPQALQDLGAGPLTPTLPLADEQLLPNLLINPHMLPRKAQRAGGWQSG